MSSADRLYTAEQAAKALGVEAHTIRRWEREEKAMPAGKLRGRGRGGLISLFTLAELQPLAAEHLARRRYRSRPDTPPETTLHHP